MNNKLLKAFKESFHRFFSCALTLILGLVLLVSCSNPFNKDKSNVGSQNDGSISFKLYDETSTCVISDTIEFYAHDSVLDALKRAYNVETRVDTTIWGSYTAILSITKDTTTYSTTWNDAYLAFYVNGEYATKGAEDTYCENGMNVEFKWEAITY